MNLSFNHVNRGTFMASALVCGSSGQGLKPLPGTLCFVLGTNTYCITVPFHPGVVSYPEGSRNTLVRFMLQKPGVKGRSDGTLRLYAYFTLILFSQIYHLPGK